jgi:ADP-heptose:LPS heptosyltransferase
MLNYKDVDVVMVGGEMEALCETRWVNEKRVHRRCGVWEIRQSLAFLDVADCVVGPETGVLNAAAMLDIPKIVFLSHSTHENLTKGWKNVYPLMAQRVTCKGRGDNEAPACHQLHYSWDHCTQDSDPDCEDCKPKPCEKHNLPNRPQAINYDPNCDDCREPTCKKHTHMAVCQAAITPPMVCEILDKEIAKVLEMEAA